MNRTMKRLTRSALALLLLVSILFSTAYAVTGDADSAIQKSAERTDLAGYRIEWINAEKLGPVLAYVNSPEIAAPEGELRHTHIWKKVYAYTTVNGVVNRFYNYVCSSCGAYQNSTWKLDGYGYL